jgi:hypothetical protein
MLDSETLFAPFRGYSLLFAALCSFAAIPAFVLTFASLREIYPIFPRICRLTRPKMGCGLVTRIGKIRIRKQRIPLGTDWISIVGVAA